MKTKLIFTAFILFCVSACIVSSALAAQVPRLLNYQGKLTDKNNVPLDGTYPMTFRIYDADTAGNRLWEEIQSAVVCQKGIFSVLLGSVTTLGLAFDKPYFLEVVVGSEVMSPRQRIVSAGYAISAEYGVPAGTMLLWPTDTAPYGYLLCNGAAVSRATYAGLFVVLGTTYGAGDGSATFNLPDLRGRFPLGKDNMGGTSADRVTSTLADALGGAGGSEIISATNLPAHTHAAGTLAADSAGAHTHSLEAYLVTVPVGTIGTNPGLTGNPLGGGSSLGDTIKGWTDSNAYFRAKSGGAHTHTISGSTASTGSGTAYNQPFLTLNYIIKY